MNSLAVTVLLSNVIENGCLALRRFPGNRVYRVNFYFLIERERGVHIHVPAPDHLLQLGL